MGVRDLGRHEQRLYMAQSQFKMGDHEAQKHPSCVTELEPIACLQAFTEKNSMVK